jgi:prepilin-type N-terminal cleavage/methylation domain-containing protein/prepilin-type processing-associated H-X9-DG protein
MHQKRRQGFTLVELLVVIGIIALLIGIVMPALSKAREAANTIKCASNLRCVGQGLTAYIATFKATLPVSYIYEGMSLGPPQTPAAGINGYGHWSGLLYGKGVVSAQSFTCPSLENGGLPPTNPAANNLDPGQVNETPGIIDLQAPRMAYTLNEALCGRNKFVIGFQGAVRTYQYVRAPQVRNAAATILATEFVWDWRIVSDAPRTGAGTAVSKSHRPVHGFTSGSGGSALNMEKLAPGATYRRVIASDLTRNCPVNYDSTTTNTRLDWVGRNHGKGPYDQRTTNFLYLDGHVETKNIKQTLQPFEWGNEFYSLSDHSGLQ